MPVRQFPILSRYQTRNCYFCCSWSKKPFLVYCSARVLSYLIHRVTTEYAEMFCLTCFTSSSGSTLNTQNSMNQVQPRWQRSPLARKGLTSVKKGVVLNGWNYNINSRQMLTKQDNTAASIKIKMSQVCSLINPLCTNRFFQLVGRNTLGLVHCIYWGVTAYNFQIKLYFFL